VLYYGAGNNNLSRDLNMEMGGLRNAGSSDEIQLVAQLAGDSGDVVRGEMAPISLRFGGVHPELIEKKNFKADMGKKETLADFLSWGMKEYPAKHYLVIQAGHGNGHRGSMTDETTGSIITPVEQREAYEAAPEKVDVLLKESCMGASLEEAFEMKDTVGYYLGSQDLTKGSVDLYGFLQDARKEAREGELKPRDVVRSMTEHPARDLKTFSAIDCSKLGAVGYAVAEFKSAVDTTEELVAAQRVAGQTPRVKPDGEALTSNDEIRAVVELKRLQYRDALGFAEAVAQESESLEKEAGAVATSLREAIIHQYSDPEYTGQTGLSWNLSPDPSVSAGAVYSDLAFAKETGWTGVIS
jgi:hypothetical protein